MFRFYLRHLLETFLFMIYLASCVQFKLETHTESREIDFYCVVQAVCIFHFLTKQVHFFVRQISYSTLVEGQPVSNRKSNGKF